MSTESATDDPESLSPRRFAMYLCVVIVLGAVVGVGAGLLSLLLYGIEKLALGFVETSTQPGPFETDPVRRILSVVVGSVIAAIVWWLLRTRSRPVPSVSKAVSGTPMPWWQTIVHVLLQIMIVGCGSSIGREVAPRELGALMGQWFGRVVPVSEHDRRIIVAVAAAAGLAGVYDAPLAGLFFVTEILVVGASVTTAAVALGASVVAAFVASLIKGRHVFYDVSGLSTAYTPTILIFSLVAGMVFGLVGALFRRASAIATGNRPTGSDILWMMPAAAVVTGLVALVVPQVMGNGRASAQLTLSLTSMTSPVGVVAATAALTFLAKAVVTLLTLRSGASGGVLQPGIALGMALGTLLGCGWIMVMPGDSLAACAVMGGAALLAASQKAPLMAMCLVFELVNAPMSLVVPVGLAVAVSSMVAHCVEPRLLRIERNGTAAVSSER